MQKNKLSRRRFLRRFFTMGGLAALSQWRVFSFLTLFSKKASAVVPFAFWKSSPTPSPTPMPSCTLWSWGGNVSGQLGIGNTTTKSSPVQIGTDANWSAISVNWRVSHAIRDDGTLWGFGESTGNLGDGASSTYRSSPVQIGALTNWSKISTGYYAAQAIKSDGRLWAWGSNSSGNIGDGTSVAKYSPVAVGSLTNWVEVANSNGGTNLAIKSDGTLWAWGYNYHGQVGNGSTVDKNSPVQIGTETDWAKVAAGGYHSLALKSDGSLWAWGSNSDYQLGIVSWSPTQVGTGTWEKVVCRPDNTTDWSESYYGMAGIAKNGTLWAVGIDTVAGLGGSQNIIEEPTQVGSLTTWVDIASCGWHTAAVKNDGTLWTWGENWNGELGYGNTISSYAPYQVGTLTNWSKVACGDSHTVAIRTDGTLWTWGYNWEGQLGDGTNVSKSSPVQIGSLSWIQIAAGGTSTAAIRSDNTLWTWGHNGEGGLGHGNITFRSSPVQVGTHTNWESVSNAGCSMMAVKTNGTLWAWGRNQDGNLGEGTVINRSSPVQIGTLTNWNNAAMGSWHAGAIKDDGSLWMWGFNEELSPSVGDQTVYSRSSPVQVGVGNTWKSLTCGANTTYAIRSDDTLWSWGGAPLGRAFRQPTLVTPLRKFQYIAGGFRHSLAISSGTVYGAGSNPYSEATYIMNALNNIISFQQSFTTTDWQKVAAGDYRSAAIKTNGTLWTWGDNFKGALGRSGTAASPAQVGSYTTWVDVKMGLSHSIALKS